MLVVGSQGRHPFARATTDRGVLLAPAEHLRQPADRHAGMLALVQDHRCRPKELAISAHPADPRHDVSTALPRPDRTHVTARREPDLAGARAAEQFGTPGGAR